MVEILVGALVELTDAGRGTQIDQRPPVGHVHIGGNAAVVALNLGDSGGEVVVEFQYVAIHFVDVDVFDVVVVVTVVVDDVVVVHVVVVWFTDPCPELVALAGASDLATRAVGSLLIDSHWPAGRAKS